MNTEETFNLIEQTIKSVEGDYPFERLIQDCADKLSMTSQEVMNILTEFDSDLIKH